MKWRVYHNVINRYSNRFYFWNFILITTLDFNGLKIILNDIFKITLDFHSDYATLVSSDARRKQMTYTVYANVEQKDFSKVSQHRTLKAAGKAYQAAHTGNLRRVLDQDNKDVTSAACNAVVGV